MDRIRDAAAYTPRDAHIDGGGARRPLAAPLRPYGADARNDGRRHAHARATRFRWPQRAFATAASFGRRRARRLTGDDRLSTIGRARANTPAGRPMTTANTGTGGALRDIERAEARFLKEPTPANASGLSRAAAETVDRAYAAIAAQGGRPACRKGCHWCCVQTVAMSVFEAAPLVEHVRRAWTAEQRAALLERCRSVLAKLSAHATDADRIRQRIPCVFLQDDGGCGVYEARPLACRVFNSQDLAACRRVFEQGDLSQPPPGYSVSLALGYSPRVEPARLMFMRAAIGILERAGLAQVDAASQQVGLADGAHARILALFNLQLEKVLLELLDERGEAKLEAILAGAGGETLQAMAKTIAPVPAA